MTSCLRSRVSEHVSTGCWTPWRRRCARPLARSTRPPTASARTVASARSRRSRTTVPAAIAGIEPRLDGLRAPARGRRLRVSGPADAGRLLCDALALAAARTRARSAATPGCRTGSRPSAHTPPGRRSRPRAGFRHDHEPRQQPRQGGTRARRGQGAQAHGTLRRRGRGRAARRPGCGHRAGRGIRRRRPRQRPHRRRAGRGRHARAALQRGGDGALSSLSHASRAVGVLRANDLPPLVAGSPASAVGLLLYGVSDPGNLGTLLRSAQGFGPAHVALAEGSRRSALAARGASQHGRALLRAGDHAAARRRCCP